MSNINNKTKKKMLPIGIENFEKMIELDYYYVDKTNLIKELLDNINEVTLFTRPRRFGKTLNMSMLKYFFDINTNKNLFNNLNISRETELCEKYLGKFPVISISLKGVEGLDFEKSQALLIDVIREEACQHRYLLQSDVLDEIDKQRFKNLFLSDTGQDIIEQGLMFLSQLLHKHYNQKAIILIDEYDVPLAKAFDYNYYDQMVVLIRNILH
ncbi:MAG: AAA family ATPase, partial [Oscillospiraceae bacterium]|nr:AAA family ATPase [Oscillospiraceae bacterium]